MATLWCRSDVLQIQYALNKTQSFLWSLFYIRFLWMNATATRSQEVGLTLLLHKFNWFQFYWSYLLYGSEFHLLILSSLYPPTLCHLAPELQCVLMDFRSSIISYLSMALNNTIQNNTIQYNTTYTHKDLEPGVSHIPEVTWQTLIPSSPSWDKSFVLHLPSLNARSLLLTMCAS